MAWKNVQYKDGKMRTSEGGGGGGSSTFAGLDDVNFSNLQNGQVPKYNSNTQKWENANESGGGETVTDVEVDGVSVVNQQGVAEIPAIPDGLHHYSTTEQVIGTWIDGQTIYERTFVFDTPLSVAYNTWVDTGVVLGDGWKIIHADFIDAYNANLGAMNVTPYSSMTGNPVGVMNLRNATISLKYMILQYTKTTDV